MVKKRVKATKVRKEAKEHAGSAQAQQGPSPPGHVKKKVTKKLHFLERVADSKQQALAARSVIRKKKHKSKAKQAKALPDLSSLAELLAEVDHKQQQQQQDPKQQQQPEQQSNTHKGRTEQITGSKARRIVTQTETARLQQVLAHPDFKANPLAAIKNHLAATLPEPAPQPQRSALKMNHTHRGNHKKKKPQAAAPMQS